jgi:hypothetical protein
MTSAENRSLHSNGSSQYVSCLTLYMFRSYMDHHQVQYLNNTGVIYSFFNRVKQETYIINLRSTIWCIVFNYLKYICCVDGQFNTSFYHTTGYGSNFLFVAYDASIYIKFEAEKIALGTKICGNLKWTWDNCLWRSGVIWSISDGIQWLDFMMA